MRKPDFFVVGAAKSGTTALWKYFQQHPEIFVTDLIGNKELGYYSNQYGIDSEERYLSHFLSAKPHQLIGEVCHVYLTSEESAKWIKKEVSNAKIIIILRHPVERAYSLYNWMTMHGYEYATTFAKALKKETKIINNTYDKTKLTHDFEKNYHYFNSGFYYNQVKRFLDTFGEQNVLILEYEEFLNHEKQVLNSIFNFLGVSTDIQIVKGKTNKSKKVMSVPLQYWLKTYLNKTRGMGFKRKQLIQRAIKWNIIDKKPSAISAKLKHQLEEGYAKDVKLLSELCGIDFIEKWNIKTSK
ncbi:sulfotransferase family protein [Psychroserpens mesophilus]|uniref:sulfotransferase family protein n=1 Tax=Psychroserpens mesophilus TaxID=325473 RepID=UPI003D6558B7